MPLGSFGHTGFTGTSIWVDPRTEALRDLPVEPPASRTAPATSRRCARASPPSPPRRSATRRRLDDPTERCASTGTDFGASPDPARPVRRHADDARAHRHRRARARRLRRAAGAQGRPHHQPHRPRRQRRADHRPAAQGAGRDAGRALQPRARHPRRARRGRAVVAATRRPGLPIHSLYGETRRPDRRDARRASTRWSSTCRTSARASTPTRRRWAT